MPGKAPTDPVFSVKNTATSANTAASGSTAVSQAAPTYHKLSSQLQEQMRADAKAGWQSPWRTPNEAVLRRDPDRDRANLWRPAFVRDVEKILHSAYYNRLADKTQVFSFYKNDDLTRRGLHVQLVSRTARTIGSALGLNTDLIEAIALAHDIGHTPFGHAGERYLSALFQAQTGRYFHHNVHSVRVLDQLFNYNLSLQTLDGALCHNGEFGVSRYHPPALGSFASFDNLIEEACTIPGRTKNLVAATLEGCVVRVCDMVAYVGKDRQDAQKVVGWEEVPGFTERNIGASNAAIINNITVDLIENSYGKDYIALSDQSWRELERVKRENYELIYGNPELNRFSEQRVKPLFEQLYERLLADIQKQDTASYIWRHHVRFVQRRRGHYGQAQDYATSTEPNQIVVDYIASMTDDYFIDLYRTLFPQRDPGIEYVSYFKDAAQLRLEL